MAKTPTFASVQPLRQAVRQTRKDFLAWAEWASSELAYHTDLTKHALRLPKLSQADRTIVETLKREGVCVTSFEALGLASTPQLLEAVEQALPSLPQSVESVVSHVISTRHSVRTQPHEIVAQYPVLFHWGLEERLLNLAENYCGLPVLYNRVELRKELADGQQIGTRKWHIDSEDRRVFKAIVYLNDVDENGGPFEYVSRTHTKLAARSLNVRGSTGDEMSQVIPRSEWRTCTGPAGTIVFVDTGGVFHRGRVPGRDRTALFFCYNSRNPREPERCKALNPFSPEDLQKLSAGLSERQKSCLYL